jgi:hypothetical protein
MKLEVIIPYRNRKAHLEKQLPHLYKTLKSQGLDFGITVVEQEEGKLFNTGMMKNIGFLESQNADYYCFHDVDMYAKEADYSPVTMPTHLARYVEQYNWNLPYREYFGGVTLFDKASYFKINGYSNEYWGWAVDDDDLYWRCILTGFSRRAGRFWCDDHARENYEKWQSDNWTKFEDAKINTEKRSGIHTTKYKVLNSRYYDPQVRHILVSI